MLIKALCDYYDKLPEDEKDFTRTYLNVSYAIDLSGSGDIVRIRSLKMREERAVNGKTYERYISPRSMFTKRGDTSSVLAYAVDHRPRYIFGMDFDNGLTVNATAEKSYKSFVEVNKAVFSRIDGDDPLCLAFSRFLDKHISEERLTELMSGLDMGDCFKSNFAFCLDGHPSEYLNEKEEVLKAFDACSDVEDADGHEAQCSVLGTTEPVAIKHVAIKGIVGGLASGCKLVCVNEPSGESYGSKKGAVGKVSRTAMNRYTQALNYLVASDVHKTLINGVTVVHWADAEGDKADELINQMAFFDEQNADDDRIEADMMLASIFGQVRCGVEPDFSSFGVDEQVVYYIVGLLPSSSRVAVKFFYRNTFGDIVKNIIRYHVDFMHEKLKSAPPFKRLCKALLPEKSDSGRLPVDITGSLLNSMVSGADLPRSLFEKAVRRVKTERSVNEIRAGIIKACINRKNKSEVITMSLNKDNNSAAYLSGRLFAVIETIQKKALGENLNRTVKDAYFASACATPAAVFPSVMKLSQSHLKKCEKGIAVYYEKIVGEILDKLDGAFPKTLSLDEQGEFILGYYQQINNFYAKKEKEED